MSLEILCRCACPKAAALYAISYESECDTRMSETRLQTIGYIHTGFAEKFGIPRQSRLVDVPGYIELVPPFNDPNALRGLEEFSHIWVLWQFSESVNEDGSWGWTPTVRPPRLGGNERKGVFATRSPVRPNAIGMSCVELIAVDTDACRIEISGADMLDGTPVYDIKPYISYSDSIPDARNGFSAPPDKGLLRVEIADGVKAQLPAHGTNPAEVLDLANEDGVGAQLPAHGTNPAESLGSSNADGVEEQLQAPEYREVSPCGQTPEHGNTSSREQAPEYRNASSRRRASGCAQEKSRADADEPRVATSDFEMIKKIIAQNPRPQYQADSERVYGMRYKDYEVKFRIDEDTATIISLTKASYDN